MSKAIIGVAPNIRRAEMIVNQLQLAGFTENQISVIMPAETGRVEVECTNETKAPEGTAIGVSTGALIGGALGLLAGIGALAVPGVGALIAAGPIMATLSGMAAGGTVGGISGCLIGMGIPEYEAKVFEGRLRDGHVLIAVHTDDNNHRHMAEEILKHCAADGVHEVNAINRKRKAS
jgi:hypothetical protein